jgi:hypothetical protein
MQSVYERLSMSSFKLATAGQLCWCRARCMLTIVFGKHFY